MSNAQFKRRFAAVLARVSDKAELVTRKTALELHANLVMKSPVDTGRFKGNWQCGIGAINSGGDSSEDKTPLGSYGPGASVGRANAVLNGWKPGQTIFLTNSMAYSRRLEYGWSKQAPGGMVRITVREYRGYLRKVANQLKNQ